MMNGDHSSDSNRSLSPGIASLANLGNTCFLNSVLYTLRYSVGPLGEVLLFAILSQKQNNSALKYRVFIKYCVFYPRILESLPPLPRQHSAAIVCTKKIPANRNDCSLALRRELWRSLIAMKAREGLQWIVKKTNFSKHTVSDKV